MSRVGAQHLAAVCACVMAFAPGCGRAPKDAMQGFEGGFDPVRFDAGPLPQVDDHALGRPLRFIVPPFYASGDAQAGARAFEAMLHELTGLTVEVQSPSAYAYGEVADALTSGTADVAEVAPYTYVLLEARGLSIVPLCTTVAHGTTTYGSYLVVASGSPIERLDQIKGKRLGFVDPLSTSGYLLPAAFLRDRGIDLSTDVTASFLGSHEAAVAAIIAGTVDVAAISSDLTIGRAGLSGPLRVLAKVGRVPYDVIVARQDLDPQVLTVVQAALLRMSIHEPKYRPALGAFSAVDAFMPVPPGHYDEIRKMARRMMQPPREPTERAAHASQKTTP